MRTPRKDAEFAELVKEGRKVFPPWRRFLKETSSRLAMTRCLPEFGEHEHRMMFDRDYAMKHNPKFALTPDAQGVVERIV